MGMYTLGDVANSSLDRLRKRFGVIGEQLYYHAWGVDLSPPFIDARTFPQKSIGKGINVAARLLAGKRNFNGCVGTL
jgi:DNA polymerase V